MRPVLIGLALAATGIVGLATALASENAPRIPSFVEETATSGINSSYDGEWEFMVGGGAAVFDCNGDGFEDLLLAGGTSPAKFYRNDSTRGGALHFEAETSGLELDKVTGAYPVDIDSDGIIDLVLLHGQLAAPAEGGRHWLCAAACAEAELLRAVDAVHRLEQVGDAEPAR